MVVILCGLCLGHPQARTTVTSNIPTALSTPDTLGMATARGVIHLGTGIPKMQMSGFCAFSLVRPFDNVVDLGGFCAGIGVAGDANPDHAVFDRNNIANVQLRLVG